MPAPYSDNMYSDPDPVRDEAQVVDAAEADALSPTDGYFQASSVPDESPLSPTSHHNHGNRQSSNVPHVPNVMVEDPSLQQNDGSSAKAQEAERERLLNSPADAAETGDNRASSTSSPFPSVTYYSHNPLRSPSAASPTISHPSAPSSTGHRHRRSVDEDHVTYYSQQSSTPSPAPYQTPRPVAASQSSDAPPAYTPTSPTSTGYQTFPSNTPSESGDMGSPHEQQALLPHQPESMGGQPQGPPPPMWQRIKEAPRSSKFRKHVKRVLGILLLLSILSALFGGMSISFKVPRPPPIFDKHPAKPPAMDDDKLTWKPHFGCLDRPQTLVHKSFQPDLDIGQGLHIVQAIENVRDGSGYSPHISGNVIIRPTDAKEAKLDVEIITNHEDINFDIRYKSGNDQQLKVETPSRIAWSSHLNPCIQMRITLHVPQKASGHQLQVDTVQLDIDVAEDLSLSTEAGSTFTTVSGHVILPKKDPESSHEPYKLSSREIIINTISGQVKGWLPLYDLLHIKTVSGNIDADVGPQAADKREVADLFIETKSGTIDVAEKVKPKSSKYKSQLPDRDYTVRIDSISARIHADLVVGSSTKISSTSGNIELDLLPLTAAPLQDWNPYLSTEAISGSLRLNVAEPIKAKAAWRSDDSSMTKFASRHKATSGSMRLVYPSSWEGKLDGKSMSGSWNVHGQGVEVHKRGGFVGKGVEATKGDGLSTIKIEQMSGNVNCLIGKD